MTSALARITGDLARQDRRRHERQADAPHLLAESRHLTVGDGERRLGRDVARRRAGAAGREDEVAADVVDELAQRRRDDRLLVGDEARFPVDRVQERAREPVAQGRQSLVFVDAGGGAVAHRDDANADAVVAVAGPKRPDHSSASCASPSSSSASCASCLRMNLNSSR
jgi:hypothetical protein